MDALKTLVISAYPGTGKSYYHNNNRTTTLDSDSSLFSWVWEDGVNTGVRDKNFPVNYIEHIKQNLGHYDVIFVSSHREVREELQRNSIYHIVVYPRLCDKEMFKQRYIDRGSPEAFVKLITDNWTEWIKDCSDKGVGYDSMEWNFAKNNMEGLIEWLRVDKQEL